MGERDDDAIARAHEARELVLRFGQAPGGDRRPLRFELEGLTPRERVQLGRALERDGRKPLLVPDGAYLVGLPDEVRGAPDGRNEVVGPGRGDPDRWLVLPAVDIVAGTEALGPPLCRGVDGRFRNRVQRPLGERRKRTHLLDLVPEQLHAQRLATRRREDVDDPSPDRELATLLDPVDALVTGVRELPGEPVQTRLCPDDEPHRPRPRLRGRQALGERRRRRADEPPCGENVQGAGAFADEVRRRLEARCVRDPAARKQRDPIGTQKPGGPLGRVSCVCVLREDDQQPSAELLVQRREDERQSGLRHACASGQRSRERLEAIARSELRDECV